MELLHKAKIIAEGWENFIDKSPIIEEVALERSKICAVCPHAKKGFITALIKDELKDIQGYYCAKCTCPLSAKIRSKDICPLKKWK